MYVCQTITFECLDVEFIFAHSVYLKITRVKFVYEDHQAKVRVTGKVKIPNSHNVKLRLAIILVL